MDFGAGESREDYKGISRKFVVVSAFSGVEIQGGSQLRTRRTGGSRWRTSGELKDFRELLGACCPPDFGAGESRESYKGISRKLVAISTFSGVGI